MICIHCTSISIGNYVRDLPTNKQKIAKRQNGTERAREWKSETRKRNAPKNKMWSEFFRKPTIQNWVLQKEFVSDPELDCYMLYGQARIHTHTHIENWDTVRHNIIKQYLCGECECVRSEPARKILLSFLAAHLKQKHTLSQTDCLDIVHTVLVQIQIDRFHFCHFFISYNYYYYYYFWIHFCVFFMVEWDDFEKKRVTWDKIIQWTKFMRHLRLRREKNKRNQFHRLRFSYL